MTSRTETGFASPASDPVVRNPYRVLGLPGEATWTEIRSAAERLLQAPEPDTWTTPWDLPWLGPVPRSEADVERALARLADPRRRLRDRLFWFHEGVAETAVYELLPSTILNALEGWSATSQPIARHDAAVVALIAAIALDPAVEKSALWQRALREWEEAFEIEAYWMDVLRLEMEGGFESPASLDEVREIREQGTELVSETLLVQAREAVIAEDLPRAARTLSVLREVLSEETFTARCGELAEHVWGSFDADWTSDPVDASRKVDAPRKHDEDSPAEAGSSLDTQNPALWDLVSADTHASTGPPAEEPSSTAPPSPPEEELPAPPGSDAATDPSVEAGPASEPPASEAEREEAEHEEAQREKARGAAMAEAPAGGADAAPGAADAPPGTTDVAPGDEPDRGADPAAARDRSDASPPSRPLPFSGWQARANRLRVPTLAAVLALLAVVALATVIPRVQSSSEAGASPADSVIRRDVEGRMRTIDAALAQALVDRIELDQEIDLLRESVEGYSALVDDYERRMARRLPADRQAYGRVVGLREEARERFQAALSDRA